MNDALIAIDAELDALGAYGLYWIYGVTTGEASFNDLHYLKQNDDGTYTVGFKERGTRSVDLTTTDVQEACAQLRQDVTAALNWARKNNMDFGAFRG